jgi:hypothetical protein
MTLAGFYLGQFPLIRVHFEKVVIGIVLVSVALPALQYFRARRAVS